MTHTVLVTGVSRHIGARVASVLAADPDIDRVIGVDTVPPPSLCTWMAAYPSAGRSSSGSICAAPTSLR